MLTVLIATGSLPFQAPYVTVGDAAEVVRLAAMDPEPGVVSWSELADVTNEAAHADIPTAQPPPFPVWFTILP